MMKYTNKYWKLLIPFMKKSLNKRYGKEYTKELVEKADGKISVNDLREICVGIMSMPMLKVVGLFINGNKKSGVRKFSKMIHKDAAWLDEHPEYKAASWDFNFDETKHDKGFYYHFTQCPLNNFARREGCLEVLPVMCDVDFLTAKLMHFKLHREHTLASGGKVCDYWYVGDKD